MQKTCLLAHQKYFLLFSVVWLTQGCQDAVIVFFELLSLFTLGVIHVILIDYNYIFQLKF